MRRSVIVLLFLVGMAVPAGATHRTTCTRVGSAERDVIYGTAGDDYICSKAGRDYVNGGAGPDRIKGGGHADTLVGGEGNDILVGGGGGDRLLALDDRPGDVLDGGIGIDQCHGDKGDEFLRCEAIYVP